MSSWGSRTKSRRPKRDPDTMKPRISRVLGPDQQAGASGSSGTSGSSRNKSDSLAVTGPAAGGGGGGSGVGGGPGSSRELRNSNQLATVNQQQATAQSIRKRRSSINVYDQPSSLNSRLRQLETDMLRLDEDRSKLHDDTHAVLAQYELRLSEIHAILKSRQDNVDKYVEDMRSLLQAKEEFEKQTKLLNEKHDRIHEKFMHRETTISREIKLLKNKFELLEKSRQFRSILQKSHNTSTDLTGADDSLNLDSSMNESQRTRSEATSEADSFPGDRNQSSAGVLSSAHPVGSSGRPAKKKSVHIKLSKLHTIGRLIAPLFSMKRTPNRVRRRRSNRVSSIVMAPSSLSSSAGAPLDTNNDGERDDANPSQQNPDKLANHETEATTKKRRNLLKRILFIR